MTHTSNPSSILIIKPSSLGDIFHTFPAVELLQSCYPDAVFDWLLKPEFADVMKFAPARIRRVIPFRRLALGKAGTFLQELTSLTRALRQEKYDLVIDFQGLFRSAIFCPVAKGPAVGFAAPREPLAKWFYRRRITIAANRVHAVERNLALVEQLTGKTVHENSIPDLPIEPAAAEKVRNLVRSAGIASETRLVGVIPGARWDSKRWPAHFFVELINRLREPDPATGFLLLGGNDTVGIAEEITKSISNSSAVLSLAGKTSIAELVEALRLCDPVVSNDSGPAHIAAALGKTVLGLFGPTDPARTGPYGDKHIFFQRDIPCIKCLKKGCRDGTFSCHNLNIDEIVSRLRHRMKSGTTP